MTQQEWENASEEERQAECQKCIDEPWYYYNTYWRRDGNPELTKEDWDKMQGFMITGSRRVRNRVDPTREMQKPVAKYEGRPEEKRYDGSAMRLNWESDPEEPFPIPISLAFSDPQGYADLVEARNKMLKRMWDDFMPKDYKPIGKVYISSSAIGSEKNLMKEIWNAQSIRGYESKLTFDTEQEAKEAYDKMVNYFLPAYKKSVDEFGGGKDV